MTLLSYIRHRFSNLSLTAVSRSLAFVLLVSSAGVLYSHAPFIAWASDGLAEPAQIVAERQVLYWAAPMDANYRRSEPGLSPMGMALIPVYAGSTTEPAGTVRISATLENNLGVRTAKARVERLQPQLSTVGLIGHDENSRVRITLRAEGWIEALQVAEAGDHVRKGGKLFEYYSPELVHAQEEYVSALAAQDKRLIRGALGRLQAYAIPQSRIDLLNTKPQVPRTLSFFAPADGHVTQLNVREGSFVDPSQVVLELVAIDRVWVRAEVLERNSARLAVGQKASMTVDYLPGRVWRGEVDYVFPMLDMATRTQPVRLRFDNFDRQLKPNMFSRIKINTSAFSALTVSRQAVIRMGDHARVVKALGQGRYRSVRVELGREVGERVVILDGLTAGTEVVTSAQFLLDSESSIGADLSRYEPTGVMEETP